MVERLMPYRTGESHHSSKLTDADVRLIRELHGDLSYSQIAKKFEVSDSTIAHICQYRIWKHVV